VLTLGIGDVQYTLQPPVPTTKDRRDSPSAPGPTDPFDLARARLQDIPKTRDEVLQASQVFTHGSRLLLDQEATEARFKSEPMADFRITHIAAHGIAGDNDVRHTLGPGGFVASGRNLSPIKSGAHQLNGSDFELPRF
jgi:CHAT domain